MIEQSRLRLGQPPNEATLFDAIKTMTIDVGLPGVDSKTGAGFVTFLPELPVPSGHQYIIGGIKMGAPTPHTQTVPE